LRAGNFGAIAPLAIAFDAIESKQNHHRLRVHLHAIAVSIEAQRVQNLKIALAEVRCFVY